MWAWHKLHSKRLLHFAALHTYCTCHSCVRDMEASLDILLTPVLY